MPHFGLTFIKMWMYEFLCQRSVHKQSKTVLMCACPGEEYPIKVYRPNSVYLDCNYSLCSIYIHLVDQYHLVVSTPVTYI